jgi:hypothetical protein
LLSVSGLLDPSIGGRSVRPFQPPKHFQFLNFPKREYEQDKGTEQWRRGVYMHWQRTFLHPMLKALDASTREECTARRPRSNTALAALTLLNDPNCVEAARGLAKRIIQENPAAGDDERIDFAFRESVARLPDHVEWSILREMLQSSRDYYKDELKASEQLVGIGMSPIPAEMAKDELASWTNVSRAILNMSETTTRN